MRVCQFRHGGEFVIVPTDKPSAKASSGSRKLNHNDTTDTTSNLKCVTVEGAAKLELDRMYRINGIEVQLRAP
jgi:hypothetical protein